MGDLNFRLDDVTGDEIKRRIAEDQSESLLQHDQVGKYLCIGSGVEVLHAQCPTYKVALLVWTSKNVKRGQLG